MMLRSLVTIGLILLAVSLLEPAERSGATFPGGNGRIAFSAFVGLPQIFTMNADSSERMQITNVKDGFEGSPDWSPDGSRIVFTSQRDSDPEQVREIYVMNADGSDQTRLTFDGSFAAGPSWSPDGTKIAYSKVETGAAQIWVMNAAGTGQTNVSNTKAAFDYDPSWSPDGSRIAFERAGDIYIMNSDGGNQIALTTGSDSDEFPNWSPDGQKIAFERNPPGDVGDEVYVVNVGGPGLANLTNHKARDYDPAWSPDGTQIAFSTERDGNYEIYVMNADGSNPVNITNSPGDEYEPAWHAERTAGDADCDEDVDSVDGLQVLRRVAGLLAHGCVFAGNVKCDDALDAVDALAILRYVAALILILPPGCPEIGT